MASDSGPGTIPAAQNIAAGTVTVNPAAVAAKAPQSGNPLDAVGKALPQRAVATAAKATADLESQVANLNKYLNDSGRPNQYRVVSSSGSSVIQEINPANGLVIGEFSASEFPALANSLGASGILIDSHV
jgi:hypothetical protein